MRHRLQLYISTCPNDTYAFEALINRRIAETGLTFEPHLLDIEQLNGVALRGEADICKISFSLYPEIADRYRILNCGAALGTDNGQVFVRRTGDRQPIKRIAVPGLHTTAYALLKRYFPQYAECEIVPMLFSKIAPAIAAEQVDAGVLIHEGRFTYQNLGLELIADLGERWRLDKRMPLPLGGIVVKRSLDKSLQDTIERAILESICYAIDHPAVSLPFIRVHAAEHSDEVIAKHIELFVNGYTVDLGETGRRAIEQLTGCNL